MAHQLIRALVEPEIQERVMSEFGNKKDVSLSELAKYVEAQEMGKRNQGILADSGALNRVLDYKTHKDGSKSDPRMSMADNKILNCSNCGSNSHSSRVKDCKVNCGTYHVICLKCNKISHYTKWSKSSKAPSKVQGQAAELENELNRGPERNKMAPKPVSMVIQSDDGGWPQ